MIPPGVRQLPIQCHSFPFECDGIKQTNVIKRNVIEFLIYLVIPAPEYQQVLALSDGASLMPKSG